MEKEEFRVRSVVTDGGGGLHEGAVKRWI